jgi:hypothetical protein
LKTHLYYKLERSITAMCEFIGYDIRDKNRIKNKVAEEEWEAEPELERVQEQQPIPVKH